MIGKSKIMDQKVSEYSCGAIVFKQFKKQIKVLLIKQINDVWNFPKGHMENDETKLDTAYREVFEETSIKDITIYADKFYVDTYFVNQTGNWKEVTYFLADTKTTSCPKKLLSEVKKAHFYPIKRALNILTYNKSKAFLKHAYKQYLNITNSKIK